ncbi:hypothetical protein KW794_01120 [Candidatus Saccharibacteria bacterium]|nr:hypothetical protein [Candidatus Saccharibacteria bacterium]
MSATQPKSLIELFKQSAQAVRRNLPLFIFLNTLTILSVAWNIGLSIRDKTTGNDWGEVIIHSIFGSSNYPHISNWLVLALIVVGTALYLMLAITSFKAAKKTTVSFQEVWEAFKAVWLKLLAVEILTICIISLGLILLIIPGLYLLSRLAFSPLVLLDHNTGVIESLNRSWNMSKNHAWTVFITILFGLILSLPSVVPVVGEIIATVLTVAYSVALPLRYFEIKKLAPSE